MPRPRDDDNDDDRPRPRRRRDEDDEDAPRSSRRRRDDDDDAPKKKSALPLILGLVGGLLLVCGGGCAGVWFLGIAPAVERAKVRISERQAEQEREEQERTKPTGKERPARQPSVVQLSVTELVDSLRTDRTRYDKKWITVYGPVTLVNTDTQPGKPDWGYVHLGVLQTGLVVCHFDAADWKTNPKFDDSKTYSITGLFDANPLGVSMDWCRVTGESGPANPPPGGGPVTADQLTAAPDKFKGKVTEVSGKVVSVGEVDGGGEVQLTAATGKSVSLRFSPANWTKGKVVPRDTLSARGTVGGVEGGVVMVRECEMVTHTPDPTAPRPAATLDAAALLKDYLDHHGKVVTVRGKVVNTVEEVDGKKGTVVFQVAENQKFGLWAVLDKGNWRTDFLRGGDTVELRGKVGGPVGNPGTGMYVELQNTELLKRTTADGKDVPVPPKGEEVIEVTADELTAEYDQGQRAADAKYKGKTLKVTGEVLRVSDAGGTAGAVVFLKGSTPTDKKKDSLRVSAVFVGDVKGEALKLKAGDAVTFTGRVLSFRAGTGTNDWTVQIVQPKLVK